MRCQHPSVVLDLAKLEVNCERMLDATERLGLQWRAHIKTHKTTELTRLQVGDSRKSPAYICVSTVKEAENVVPLLQEYRSRGREVNVLYAFPIYPSVIDRLADVSSRLGPGCLSLLIDHPDQLPCAAQVAQKAGHPPLVFLKLDTGYGRAGHSYGSRGVWDPMSVLATEFSDLRVAADVFQRRQQQPAPRRANLVLTVGATPTATTIQHPDLGPAPAPGEPPTATAAPTRTVSALFADLRAAGFALEVHAGVYPTLDLQQLATHARDARLLAADDIAISVVAEVASVYVNAGTLALGREPVTGAARGGPHYTGWGVLMPWGGLSNEVPGITFPRRYTGWCVGKITLEHGILAW